MASPQNQPKKTPPQTEDILDYVKNHTRETISYVLILVGIILMFVDQMYGGLIVGVVGGVYFGEEIVNYLKNLGTGLQSSAMTKHIVALGVAIALFIAAPAIFIGAAIAIGIQQMFTAPKA